MIPPRSTTTRNISKHTLVKEFSTLLSVSSALTASLELERVLQTAIDSTVEVLDLETGAIYLLENEMLYLGAATPCLTPEQQWLKLQPEALCGHPHLQKALSTGQPVYIADARCEPLSPAEIAIRDARHLITILYIPLLLQDRPIGALIVSTMSKTRGFGPHEVDLCQTLSSQVSLAIANAQLYKSVQQSNQELIHAYDDTLKGWSFALELRDGETQGHTIRVTQRAVELACQMGIGEPERTHIRRGALLHDIGKMGICDAILRKPGPLTPEEWTIMRRHPDYAYQFLLNIDYLLPALEIPYAHHEKWDGSGYPRGLKGQEIPLAARIFAVVDVYDALTSDRPYRKAWPQADALQYIREQSGKHFDPQVASAFLEYIRQQSE